MKARIQEVASQMGTFQFFFGMKCFLDIYTDKAL